MSDPWDWKPLKRVAAINLVSLPEDTDPDYTFRYVDIASVGRGQMQVPPQEMTFADAPSRARRLVGEGDTIVSTVRTYLRAVWPVEPPAEDLVVSTGFAVLRPESCLLPRFFAWWLQGDRFIEEVVARSVGVSYPAINAADLGNFATPVPPVHVQQAIADFLGTETTRIDALITKKRWMIVQLRDRLRALRSTTCLGSLDPTTGEGSLDGCDRYALLGVAIELQRGHDLPADVRVDGAVPVVSSGGVSGWHNTSSAQGPGVVTGRYGTVGEAYFIDTDYWPLNTTLYVRDFRGRWPKWVYHLLQCLPLDVDSAKSAVTGINRNVVGQLRVPVPELRRQQVAAAAIDEADALTQAIVDKLTRQISLLQEHRQALITAAVTGELETPGPA